MIPDIERLVRGDGGPVWVSAAERRLLKFALDTFGAPLSRFLLAGLGEDETVSGRHFTVTFEDGRGAARSREIRVEANDFPGELRALPRRREPLAMLALLRLLIEDRGTSSSSSLLYRQEQVLDLLGWEDTAETRSTIDRAVKGYVRLSYSWGLGVEELSERNLSFYDAEESFVSGYGNYNAEEGGEYKRVANRVDFSPEFVAELQRRALFEVDWNRVRELTVKVFGPKRRGKR